MTDPIRAALKDVTDALDKMGDQPDAYVCPRVWNLVKAQECIDRARAALAAPVQQPSPTGWLIDRALLYRLTDDRRPQNRDEIRVTMADGSLSPEACARRAGELFDRLASPQAVPATDKESLTVAAPQQAAPAVQTEAYERGFKDGHAHALQQAAPATPAPEAVQPVNAQMLKALKAVNNALNFHLLSSTTHGVVRAAIAAAEAVQPLAVRLTDEQMRAEFAKLYPNDDAILHLAENNRDFMLKAIGARHHWAAFKAGWSAAERAVWAANGLRGE